MSTCRKLDRFSYLSQVLEREQEAMQVMYERCAALDVHKILPNRNHLFLMISQRASILMFFSPLDVVEDR